jgi:hypothetical protein
MQVSPTGITCLTARCPDVDVAAAPRHNGGVMSTPLRLLAAIINIS